jgi:gag-polypeptide of LTR copia-type
MSETILSQTINNNITNIEVGSSQITSIQLGDYNFQLWNRQVILALHERELYEHVTGEEKKPDQEKNLAEFRKQRRNDYKAINLILNSMEPKTKQLFMYHDSSFDL